jgi:hypothetical protein
MALASSAAKLQPAVAEQTRVRVVEKPVEAAQTNISSNPIARIVLDPNIKDDQKVAGLTSAITAETLKDIQSFSSYIAEKRTLAQRRLLELTSTTAFPKLQSVIGGLQTGVIEFDGIMQPMTDDLQAAFDLRTNGQMGIAVKQISEDRETEARWATERERIKSETIKTVAEERKLRLDIISLSEDKNWFGQVRSAAMRDIADKNLDLESLKKKRETLTADSAALDKEQEEYNARTYVYKEQKARLRKMLDLGPGYVKRVEDIVAKAISFIDTSTSEVGAIRGEFDGLEEQARNILKSNGQMVRVTAILDKGIDGANARHKQRVKELDVAPKNEDTLAQVTRVQEKNDIERFVSALSETSVSTKKNVSALQEDAVQANDFNSVVMKQQTNLRELHGDGIASITTNLNMALQAFNTAALTEAGNNAWQAIGDMNKVTNKIRDSQVVATAMSVDETNKRIIEKFDSLSGVSTALQEANKIRADGISNIASSLAELAQKTAEVQKNLQVNIGLDAASKDSVAPTEPHEAAKKNEDLMLNLET